MALDIDVAHANPSLTRALRAAHAGETGALDRLFELVEPELRRRAERARARGPSVRQIRTTSLVHDVFFRLQQQRCLWRDRDHYFAMTTVSLRRLLLDLAKQERRQETVTPLDDLTARAVAHLPDPDLVLDLHAAIARLAAANTRWGRIAELRAFGGRNNHEIAALLGVSLRTVEQDWTFVRAWLHRELET